MTAIKSSVISKKTAVVATHENYDSAISSLIVQVICCVWLPVLGRSSTWPIKKKKLFVGHTCRENIFLKTESSF